MIPYYIHKDDADAYDKLVIDRRILSEKMEKRWTELGGALMNRESLKEHSYYTARMATNTIELEFRKETEALDKVCETVRLVDIFQSSKVDLFDYCTYMGNRRCDDEFGEQMTKVAQSGMAGIKKVLENK